MSAPYDQPPKVDPQTGASPVSNTDPQHEVPTEDKPLSALLSDLTSQLSQLVRKEVELATTEIKEEARRAGKAAGAMGAAGLAGYFCLLLLSFAAAWGLSEVLPAWAGFLIVAVLWGIGAAVLFTTGKKKIDQLDPKPQQTIETLKEDAEWAKNRTR